MNLWDVGRKHHVNIFSTSQKRAVFLGWDTGQHCQMQRSSVIWAMKPTTDFSNMEFTGDSRERCFSLVTRKEWIGNEWKLKQKQKQVQSALWEHLAIQGGIELRKQNRRDKIWCSGTFVFECPLESPV